MEIRRQFVTLLQQFENENGNYFVMVNGQEIHRVTLIHLDLIGHGNTQTIRYFITTV